MPSRLLLPFVLLLAVGSPAAGQRKPLVTTPLTQLDVPPVPPQRKLAADGRTYVWYDPDLRVKWRPATADFAFSWMMERGRRQTVIYRPPWLASPIVAADVSRDAGTGLYTYHYTVTNLKSSRSLLSRVLVEASGVESSSVPPQLGRVWPLTSFLIERLAVLGGVIFPLGEETRGIPPGRTASGLRLVSRYPPGAVRVWGRSDTHPIEIRGEEAPEELSKVIQAIQWHVPTGYTIGPVPVAMPRTARGELEELTSMLAAGEAQGWFDGAVAQRVRAAVADLTATLARADTTATRRGITSLLAELDTLTYRDLLPEARALLRYRLPVVAGKIW